MFDASGRAVEAEQHTHTGLPRRKKRLRSEYRSDRQHHEGIQRVFHPPPPPTYFPTI